MPRKSEIRELIPAIAEQLVQAGQDPTPHKVREVLGRGSYSTISDELESWRAERIVFDISARHPAPPISEIGTRQSNRNGVQPHEQDPRIDDLIKSMDSLTVQMNRIQQVLDEVLKYASHTALSASGMQDARRIFMQAADEARDKVPLLQHRIEVLKQDAKDREDYLLSQVKSLLSQLDLKDANIGLSAFDSRPAEKKPILIDEPDFDEPTNGWKE